MEKSSKRWLSYVMAYSSIHVVLALSGCSSIMHDGGSLISKEKPIVTASSASTTDEPQSIVTVPKIASVTPITLTSTFEVKPIGHLVLNHERVIQVGLSDSYIYWVTYQHRDQVRRRSLSAVEGTDEVFVVSAYDHGMVDVNPPILTSNQLVFLDTSADYKQWQVRTIDLNTKAEKVIGKDNHADNVPPRLEGHGPWIVLTFVKWAPDQKCALSTLEAFNLDSAESTILDQTCIENNYLWNYGMAAGQTVVAERDQSTTQGGATQIVSFNLLTKQSEVISKDDSSSEPDISAGFVVWKAAKRFDYGRRIWVLNRSTSQLVEVALPSTYAYMGLNDVWIYALPDASNKPIYIYNLPTNSSILVASPGKDEGILNPIVFKNLVAWVRIQNASNPGESTSVLEWASLVERSNRR